jgi:succinoglycan biosynthesis transport protein ExoP
VKKELEFHAGALPAHANPDDEADRLPINYLHLIVRYKWRLLCGLAGGLVLGHFLYLKAGPEFEAHAEILVQRKYSPPIREEEKMLSEGSLPSEHIKLILSPMIASEAVEQGHLDVLPTFQGEPDMSEVILDKLKVKRVAGQDRSHSNVFDIRYTSKRSDDATKVLSAVIVAYEDYLKKNSSEQSREVQLLAKNATKNMLDRLHEKEIEYREFLQGVPEEFRSALGDKASPNQTQTHVAPQDVIQSLGEERNRNRIKVADLRSRQQAVQRAIAAGDSRDVLEHQVRRFLNTTDGRSSDSSNKANELSIYQSQLLPLLLKEKELAREFGRNWPALESVRRSIDTVVQTYRKLGIQLPEGVDANVTGNTVKPVEIDFVALYLAEVKQQLDELQIKDEELGNLIAAERDHSKDFAGYQAKDQHLRVELNKLQDLWSHQVNREGSVAVEKDSNGYRLTRLAPVKHALVVKRMIKFYAGGAAVCLFLVAITGVLQELKDLRLKTVRDVRMTLRQPVLGSVCEFVIPADNAGPASGVPHPALRYLHAPSSVEAENYRTIRTSLLVTAESRGAKVIMVSSAEPGDGKTTLISNLAVALAQSGKRVLLIDADLRRPTLNRMFRIPQGKGLTDVLSGELDLLSAVRPSVVERLSLLTAGTAPANPAEILSSSRLHWVLDEAREEFDFVFLDAPPMLAVSDPCVLARDTDGILIVVRLNKNTRTALARVRELLNDQNIPVLGAVVNGVPLKGGHEYGYTYYGEYLATPAQPTETTVTVATPLLIPENLHA